MQLFGPDKSKLGLLKNYKDYCIESVLSTGDKTLSILHPASISKNIVEEGYIQNKTNEYVIKEIATQGDWIRIKAKLNVEDLEGKVFESFETVAETITDCINLALAGTGWIVGSCDVTKRRTVRKTNSSSWDIIQEAKKVYRCELEFDTLKKKINIYEKRGADKGVYFIDTLNLKNLDVQSDSYDYYTRIIAKGKGDLKVTLENFQYSNKVKTYIWKDERYTDIDSLTEDARAKLNDLSKPYRSYKATIIDLANISKENYKNILSYSLGDIITLVSKENRIREKQRIVKITEYPDEPDRNTCEMANTILTFEDIQKELQETSNTVNNITTDNGTIDGSSINGITTEQIYDFEASIGKITDLTIVNARIDELYATKANISELNAVVANVAELFATKATITELNALSANINTALIGKADITELNALNATIKVLEVDTAAIKTLVNGNLSSENIQAGGITSDKLTIANGFITNAMIASLDVSKINAGTISTNKFRIVSDDGGIEIVGATQQFKDKNNKVRIQMGQDTQGNFNFILRGEDGTTTLIDHTGIKERAIADNLIKENMVAADAIGEKQINYSSLITGLNKDTNTQLIKASKVAIDLTGQSLEVAFNSLKSNVDNMQIGGRNLILNSKTILLDGSDNGNSNCSVIEKDYVKITPENDGNVYNNGGIKTSIPRMQGKIYTLSFEVLTPTNIGFYWYPSERYTKTNYISANSKWQKVIFTYTQTGENSSKNTLFGLKDLVEGNTYYYRNLKLEEGNKATDWTPALEDVDSKIESNSTTINVMQGQIATAINNTQIVKDGQTILLKDDYNRTVSKVDSINSTIGTHTTKLNQLTGNITNVDTKVNSVQRDLEGTKSTVSSHTSQISGLNSTVNTQGSSINQLKNQIALKVEQTDINNAINKIEIGGRNLFKGHKRDQEIRLQDYENVGSFTQFTSNLTFNPALYLNKEFTISFYAKSPNGQTELQVYNRNGSPRYFYFNKTLDNALGTSWKFYSYTFKNVDRGNSYSISNKIEIYAPNKMGVLIKNLKVELGNKNTDFTEAPEDVQTQINTTNNKVATIETNLNSITSRVSSTESTISTHTIQLGTVDNRINTAKNSAINTAASDATTKANNAVN
ncbi:phage tail spike protein, partial [uncultured Clostridium sp.]